MSNFAPAKSNWLYPDTCAEMQKTDDATIELCYAIKKEAGPTPARGHKDQSRKTFEEMSEAIAVQTGRKISAAMLARYRGIGNAFPQRDLIPEGVSFSVLESAKTPEYLDLIMEKLPGVVLTRELVRKTLKDLNKEDRDKEHAEKLRKAEEEVASANKVLKETGSTKKLDSAEKKLDKVRAQIKTAKEPRKPRRVNSKTLVKKANHVVEIISSFKVDLHNVEDMSADDWRSLNERCQCAASMCEEMQQMLAPDEKVEKAA